MEHKFINNTEKKRYELHTDGLVSFVEYMIAENNTFYLTHTEVPEEIENKGIGTELVKRTLEDIKQNNGFFYPLCPFVKAYVKRNKGWDEYIKH